MSSGDFFVLFGQSLGTGEKFKSKLFLEPVTATGDTNGLEVPSPGRNNLLHVHTKMISLKIPMINNIILAITTKIVMQIITTSQIKIF